MRRKLVLAAAAAAVLLAGCGGDPAPAAPDHNGTDVMYLQMMLAHHEPSAGLLALGRSRATRPDVRAMAAEFETARAAETTMMTGWLEEWGQPLTADADPAVHAGHGAGLHALGATEIAELAAMSPQEFDLAFVNVLIGHQHGAVELARMETAGGANPEVKELARRTDEAVRAQIQQMLRMVA
jgi:uncharacterized protein (DUF305 family)